MTAVRRTRAGMSSGAEADELDHILATGRIRSVYQPVVDLDTDITVGYEALARGPVGSILPTPDLLFAAARAADRVTELDHGCQRAAISGAHRAGLNHPWALFVNVEAGSTHDVLDTVEPHTDRLRVVTDDAGWAPVVIELTERALMQNPPQLLRLVDRIRARGWGIALDDVGADPNSLALLPILQPDVIKLDLRLVQQRPSRDIAQIVGAVNAESERSGSVLLAEGIETREHLDIALGLGATLGQGWFLGRPAALPEPVPDFTGPQLRMRRPSRTNTETSAFHVVRQTTSTRIGRKSLLVEMTKHLERQAVSSGEATIVLTTFQDATSFTPDTARRFRDLARTTAFVGALGHGMPAKPAPGVRGGPLQLDDPLNGEWVIAVIGPHFAATLVAHELHDLPPEEDRRFEFALTHQRTTAIDVAATLMARISPSV